MEKDASYYLSRRDELIDLIDCGATTRVLDVGCAAGVVGMLLKAKGCGEVHGIELVGAAAEEAKKNYNSVLVGDVETLALPYEKDWFDYIVCGDVIEHLRDPWEALKKLRAYLKPAGYLIASIPNIRHRVVIGELLRGNFDYVKAGILDNTHLRFFTFTTVVKLFVDAGYKIEGIAPNLATQAEAILPYWKQSNLPQRIHDVVKLLTNAEFTPGDEDLNDLLTVQFILKARKKV